jgi:hypothetical protein
MAWRPGPAVDAARSLRAHWCGRRTRGGVLTGGPVAASRWQGLGFEHHDYAADPPGK